MTEPNLVPKGMDSVGSPSPIWELGPFRLDFRQPLVMGVLNATPDSFSDGGQFLEPEHAADRAIALAAQGADVIDLGGASSHPRAKAVSMEQEWSRIGPVLERLVQRVPVPISIDTQHGPVAEAALAAGAHIINDVSGRMDNGVMEVAAQTNAPLVITCNHFNVPVPGKNEDPIAGMQAFFRERLRHAEQHGVERIMLDPGYGFGKSLALNKAVLRRLGEFNALGRPLLVCTSRKGSLGKLSGEPIPEKRIGASIASSLFAVHRGAAMVRVHDVELFRQALNTWRAFAE